MSFTLQSRQGLGDIICNNGKNDLNIEKRRNNGIGAVSSIMSTLKQVMLGHFHFEVGLIMRDTMLISKMIYLSFPVLEELKLLMFIE